MQPNSTNQRRTIAFTVLEDLQCVGRLLADLVKAGHDERKLVVGTHHHGDENIEEKLASVVARKLMIFQTLILWGIHHRERTSAETHDLKNWRSQAESMAHGLASHSEAMLQSVIAKTEPGKVVVFMPLAGDSATEIATLMLRHSSDSFHTSDILQ